MKKNCMITGAGRGMGLVLAKKMAKDGWNLFLTELPERIEELIQQAANFEVEYKIKAHCMTVDIRKTTQIEEIFNYLNQNEHYVDALVCNVGVNNLMKAIEVTEEIWDEINDINVKGNFFVMQQAAQQMILNEGGSIVTISSQHGVRPNYNRAPYCASKAALIHLCKELALEWAPYNIRVNIVSPTYILYESNQDILLSPKGKREYLNSIPLHEYCTDEDVANSAQFLLSKEAKMITGHNLVVDGGWILK